MKKFLTKNNIPLVSVALLVIAAFVIRCYKIGQLDLWRDEAFAAILSQKSLLAIIQTSLEDTEAPLLEFIYHFWIKIFGASEISLRFPSVVFSVATIPFLYLVSRKYYQRTSSVLVASLYTVNIISIYYAREARAYSLLTFLLLVSFYYLCELIEKFRWKKAVVFVISTSLAFYAHNLAVFFIGAEVFCILYILGTRLHIFDRQTKSTGPQKKDMLIRWGVTLTGLFVVTLPWLIAFIQQAVKVQKSFWLTFHPVHSVTETFVSLTTGQALYASTTSGFLDSILILGTIVLLLFGTGYELTERKKQRMSISYFFWFPVIVMYLYSFIRPLFYVRYLVFLMPFYILLVYKGISTVFTTKRVQIIVVGVFAILSMNLYFNYYLTAIDSKPHYKALVGYIEKNVAPNDAAVHIGPLSFFPYEHYYRETKKRYPQSHIPKSTIYDPKNETPSYTGKSMMYEEDFTRKISELKIHERIWLIEKDRHNSHLKNKFRREYRKIKREKFNNDSLTVELWVKK